MDFFDKSHPPLGEQVPEENARVTTGYKSFIELDRSKQEELFNSILLRFPIIQEELDEQQRLKTVQDQRLRSLTTIYDYGISPYKEHLDTAVDAVEKYNVLEKTVRDIIISGVESGQPSRVLSALSSLVIYYQENLQDTVEMPYSRIIEGLKLIKLSVKDAAERRNSAEQYPRFSWIQMSVWANIWDGDWLEARDYYSFEPEFRQLRSAALYTSTDKSSLSFKLLPTEIIQMILNLLVTSFSTNEVTYVSQKLRRESKFLIGISSLCKSWSGEIRELILSRAVVHSPAGLKLFAKQVMEDRISHTIKTLTLNLDNDGKYFSVFRSFRGRVDTVKILQIVGAGHDSREKRLASAVLDEIKLNLFACNHLKFNYFYFSTGLFRIPMYLSTLEFRHCIFSVTFGDSAVELEQTPSQRLCQSLTLVNCRIISPPRHPTIQSTSTTIFPYLVTVKLDTLYPLRHLSASFPNIHTLILLPPQIIPSENNSDISKLYNLNSKNSLTEVVIIEGLDQFLKLKTLKIRLGPIIEGKQWPENREDVEKFAEKQGIKLEWIL